MVSPRCEQVPQLLQHTRLLHHLPHVPQRVDPNANDCIRRPRCQASSRSILWHVSAAVPAAESETFAARSILIVSICSQRHTVQWRKTRVTEAQEFSRLPTVVHSCGWCQQGERHNSRWAAHLRHGRHSSLGTSVVKRLQLLLLSRTQRVLLLSLRTCAASTSTSARSRRWAMSVRQPALLEPQEQAQTTPLLLKPLRPPLHQALHVRL